jgi:hypothetical protein
MKRAHRSERDAANRAYLRFGDHSVIITLRQTTSQAMETSMFIKSLAMASAGLALVAAPVAATAASVNPASSLSVAKSVRAGTPTKKSSNLAGASVVPIVIGVGIVAAAAYLIIDHEDKDDNSDSN